MRGVLQKKRGSKPSTGSRRRKLSMRKPKDKRGKVMSRKGMMRAMDTPPSKTEYFPNGNKKIEFWTGEDAKARRANDLPVEVSYYGDEANKIMREIWSNDKRSYSRKLKPANIEYYRNGNKRREDWYLDGIIFRENDLPSTVLYHENGNKMTESWFQDGNYYVDRGDLPNSIHYDEDGRLKTERWYSGDHAEYRENGPALIEYYPNGTKMKEEWYTNREFIELIMSEGEDVHHHNDDGFTPSLIEYYPNGNKMREEWYDGEAQPRFEEPTVIEFYPDGTKKLEQWISYDELYRADGLPAEIEYHENGKVKRETWFAENEKHRDGDRPAELEYYPNGNKMKETWYREGYRHRDNLPAVVEFNEDGEVVVQEMWIDGRYNGDYYFEGEDNSPLIELSRNISLFYESCQMNVESSAKKADLDQSLKEKIIKYVLDPVVYLNPTVINAVLRIYDSVTTTIHDKNATFYELIFNERHMEFLTMEESLSPEMLDSRLLITQWTTWYYQHTQKDARELIDKLRANIGKIETHLPNVYKPGLYADLFEDFFFRSKTINDLSSPGSQNPYANLNFYLHAGDESGYADRIIDKMVTGLKNYNYLHEWIDSRLEENDTRSLEQAKEVCKIGRSGDGWMCGDGLFDTIPSLLAEVGGDIEWKQMDADEDKNKLLNLWSFATAVMKRAGKKKSVYPSFRSREFIRDVQDLLWENKTFRTKWGYNSFDTLSLAFSEGGSLEKLSEVLGMNILESIYDSLPE